MRSFLRFAAILAVLVSLALPARSVVPDKDIQTTFTNLLQELQGAYSSVLHSDSLLVNSQLRRETISKLVKEADEVTVMLYTQRTEFSFDLAFALERVTSIRAAFQDQARLSNKSLIDSRAGLRRYTLLDETLRDMVQDMADADSMLVVDDEPMSVQMHEEMDSVRSALLDSCLRYTGALTSFYAESVDAGLKDSLYFADTEQRLQQAYDYAQATYADSQKNRYIGGNVNIVHILRNWKTFIREIKEDLRIRYETVPTANPENAVTWNGPFVIGYATASMVMLIVCFLLAALIVHLVFKRIKRKDVVAFKPIISAILAVFLFAVGMALFRTDLENPYWRMAYGLLTQFSWLTIAIFVSLLIRIRGDQAKASRNIYVPTLLMAFLSILMRAIFLPVSTVPLLLPPFLTLFIIWQTSMNIRYRTQVSGADRRYMWVSVGIMALVGILSLAGYAMIGVLILTFWTYLLALLHTITTLYYLMRRYYDDRVLRRKARFRTENPLLPVDDRDAFIEVTWLYDLLRMVIVPVSILMAFPLSVILTGRAYQLSHAGANLLNEPIFRIDGLPGLKILTVHNIILVLSLFFIFRYAIYLIKALYRTFRFRWIIEKNAGQTTPLKESDVNMSLTNTIISLVGWLLYVFAAFAILHIPISHLSTVAAGLAAGVGFALKDLINNFFYGIQLMAGRIREGDKISCDGVRGTVKRVSYQTTQIEEEDGSIIAFTNTDLFTKKFKNLNIGKNYELLKIPVCIRYGTDVERARQVILEALEPLMKKDKFGRDVIDPSFPIDIRLTKFGDSSVDLAVVLYTTVETHFTFPARALEAIYNAFYQNGIEIPFPQRDVYVKMMPEDKG